MRLHKIRVEKTSLFHLKKCAVNYFWLLPVMFQVIQFDLCTDTGWKRTQDIAPKWADVYTELGKKHTTKVRKSGISPI